MRRFSSDYGRFGEAQKKLLRKEIEDVLSRLAKESPAEPLFYFDTTGKKRRRDGSDAAKDGEDEEEPEMRRDTNRANRAQQEMYLRQRAPDNTSAAGGTPRAAKPIATESRTPAPAGSGEDAETTAAVGSAVRPRAARTPRAGGRRGGYSAQAEVPTVRFKDLGGIEQILQVIAFAICCLRMPPSSSR